MAGSGNAPLIASAKIFSFYFAQIPPGLVRMAMWVDWVVSVGLGIRIVGTIGCISVDLCRAGLLIETLTALASRQEISCKPLN